jgi:hypothetical protein
MVHRPFVRAAPGGMADGESTTGARHVRRLQAGCPKTILLYRILTLALHRSMSLLDGNQHPTHQQQPDASGKNKKTQ